MSTNKENAKAIIDLTELIMEITKEGDPGDDARQQFVSALEDQMRDADEATTKKFIEEVMKVFDSYVARHRQTLVLESLLNERLSTPKKDRFHKLKDFITTIKTGKSRATRQKEANNIASSFFQ